MFNKKKYGCALLLNQMRAFGRLVKSQKGEAEIRAWIEALLSNNADNFETPLKQKLLKESIDRDIAPPLMLASAGVDFPSIVRLPKEWRRFIASKGARLHRLSAFLWTAEVLRKFKQGIGTYKKLLRNEQKPDENYAVLNGIHDTSFVSTLSNIPAQDFLAWFRKFFNYARQWIVPFSGGSFPSINEIFIAKFPFPAIPPEQITVFKDKARKKIIHALLKMLTGDWRAAYMLSDTLEATYVGLLPAAQLAKLYAFTNAQYVYRPLWTYEAEQKGSTIALFFYSTNTFDMKLSDGDDIGYAPGYSMMTWPVIYTQHKNHHEFLKKLIKQQTDIKVQGLVSYEDNGRKPAISGNIKILYLDVQPFRPAFMSDIGRPCHIYTEGVSEQTFHDIVMASKKMNAALFIKPKRFVGNRLSPSYKRMLLDAESQEIVHVIDSGISPARLCEDVDLVICQPFTSAALFAQAAGKPVIYYDAPGFFQKNQLADYGVPLLQGRAELEGWLKEMTHVSKTAA